MSVPGQRSLNSFFVNEELRKEFYRRATETLAVLDQKGNFLFYNNLIK